MKTKNYDPRSVANFFIAKSVLDFCDTLSIKKLQALIYYTHGYSLVHLKEGVLSQKSISFKKNLTIPLIKSDDILTYGKTPIHNLFIDYNIKTSNINNVYSYNISNHEITNIKRINKNDKHTFFIMSMIWNRYKNTSHAFLYNKINENFYAYEKCLEKFINENKIKNNIVEYYTTTDFENELNKKDNLFIDDKYFYEEFLERKKLENLFNGYNFI